MTILEILEKSIIDKENKVEEINDSIKRISDKYEKSMTDIISVLGIFSAEYTLK